MRPQGSDDHGELIRAALRSTGIAGRSLDAAPGPEAIELTSVPGGSTAAVWRARWSSGSGQAAIKCGPARTLAAPLDAELEGLAAIAATASVRVPAVRGRTTRAGLAMLITEFLAPSRRPASEAVWTEFGRALAAMHRAPVSGLPGVPGAAGYGWPRRTWLGATEQSPAWVDTWPELLVHRRLAPLLAAARLIRRDARPIERALIRLERDLPLAPPASLLHGDLWSGNTLVTTAPDAPETLQIAIIDPVVAVGDAWAEVGMMRLFGGFPAACFDAHREAMGGAPPDAAIRIAGARLLHELNHLVIFGGAYRRGVLATAESIVSA